MKEQSELKVIQVVWPEKRELTLGETVDCDGRTHVVTESDWPPGIVTELVFGEGQQ